MLKIGITGGIGSGKSTICNFFKLIGIPVFQADVEAKKILNESAIIRGKMTLYFGSDIYLPNQTIDRNKKKKKKKKKKLAQLIFNSPSLLEKVNSIVHPEVRKRFFDWCDQQKTPYIIHEAAILFETGFAQMMDYNILVTAPKQQRTDWVMNRDNSSAKQVEERMSKQWPDEKKEQLADFIIKNNNQELIIPVLLELDQKFRAHG